MYCVKLFVLLYFIIDAVCDFNGPVALPSYISKCNIQEPNPNLSVCIQQSCNDALPRLAYGNKYYGLKKLRPFYEYENEIDLSGPGYSFIIESGSHFENLGETKATDLFYFDPANLTGNGDLVNDKIVIKGKYKLSGNLCGNRRTFSTGKVQIILDQVHIDWVPDFQLQHRLDFDWLEIINENSTLGLTVGCVKFKFEDSDKNYALSRCVNRYWNETFAKIQSGLESAVMNIGCDFTNTLLRQCPMWAIFWGYSDYPGP